MRGEGREKKIKRNTGLLLFHSLCITVHTAFRSVVAGMNVSR